MAHRYLHPTNWDEFGENVPMTIEDLQSWGLQYERLQKQNKQWSAPPSADKMHIAYAAPRKSSTRKTAVAASVSALAAIDISGQVEAALVSAMHEQGLSRRPQDKATGYVPP